MDTLSLLFARMSEYYGIALSACTVLLMFAPLEVIN